MKYLLFFLLSVCAFQLEAQTIIDPHTFPLETAPQNSNFEFYSRATGTNKRATFDAVRIRMMPLVRQPNAVLYTPAPTGNSTDKGNMVKSPGGGIYYIDGLGNAILMNPVATMALVVAANDYHAKTLCVPVGGEYQLSAANTLGLPPGTTRRRIYGGTESCTAPSAEPVNDVCGL